MILHGTETAGTDDPLFDRAVVVGVGLIGGSVAQALRHHGAVQRTLGVDQPAALEAIAAAQVVDEVLPSADLEEAAAGADLIILATPIAGILTTLGRLGPLVDPGTLVTDVGSTKRAICCAGEQLPAHVHFVGGHPMAGSERQGAAAADPGLFHGAMWPLCPADGVPAAVLGRLTAAIHCIGARTVLLDPLRHDRLAAAVSHVPHLVAAALSNSVGRLGHQDALTLDLAAHGFGDVTRTAASPYEIWRDILASNRDLIGERLAVFRAALDSIEASLSAESRLEKELYEAACTRKSFRQPRKFGSPD